MFTILIYLCVIYLLSAAIFGVELYALERNDATERGELWVTANSPVADPIAEPASAQTETPEAGQGKPEVTRRKRKKLIRRLHKLSS